MARTIKSEPLTVTHERRTRNLSIDTPDNGGIRVSLQRQQIVRDPGGAVLGRGELITHSFGIERMQTPKRLALMQQIADTCDEIDAEIEAETEAERAAAETARHAAEPKADR